MTARRTFLTAAGQLGLAGLLSGCVVKREVQVDPGGGSVPRDGGAQDGGGAQDDGAVLSARPGGAPPGEPPGPGEHELGVEEERDSLLYLPPSAGDGPVPLVVSLHGAGGRARHGLDLLRSAADQHGFAVLAPASRDSTWDALREGYGPDVDVIDRSLRRAADLVQVDPERIAVSGFSDGASYALGLGLANGELFGSVVAFSPGFVPPAGRTGSPRVFVSHGAGDEVLPVDRTSRRIVPQLEEDGYDVTYAEFDGAHSVPPEIVRRAVEWLGW